MMLFQGGLSSNCVEQLELGVLNVEIYEAVNIRHATVVGTSLTTHLIINSVYYPRYSSFVSHVL